MSQQIADLIERFGGAGAVSAMAARVGLSPEQTQAAIAALMPAVAGGVATKVAADGPAAVAPAAAATVDPAGDDAVAQGGGLLGQIFGGGGTDDVANKAAATTGIDASKLAALLPMLATLAAGAMAKGGTGVPGTSQGGLGGLMGMLDRDGDGNPINDVLGMFGKR